MRARTMKQLTSTALSPIYDLGTLYGHVPPAWIDAARIGGPDGVRRFLDAPDNGALQGTLPLITSHIYEYAVDIFIANFIRPDLANRRPEPVLVYAFIAHDQEEKYVKAQLGPAPWSAPFPFGYPEDLKRLAAVHNGFFDERIFGGVAPVDVFEYGDHLLRTTFTIHRMATYRAMPGMELPCAADLRIVWRLGSVHDSEAFVGVDRDTQNVWFVSSSEGISPEEGLVSSIIDEAVGSSLSRYLSSRMNCNQYRIDESDLLRLASDMEFGESPQQFVRKISPITHRYDAKREAYRTPRSPITLGCSRH